MRDFNFSLWNKITGWAAFAIALLTYTLTVEPTASFWDPGEFITTSAKLQIGHPPGAPLFQMIGAFFSMFASDVTQVALMVNMVSVFASAFTILFMFWSLTLLIRKISGPADTLTSPGKIAVLASAFVGSLAFAFTDSFWFSAVEAEVYALAMCFISAMFYIGLLWERDMLKPRGNKWLIVLGLMTGLSFGVHIMALLVIPAIGYLYYFKHIKKVTVLNFMVASVVVVGILLFIFKLLMPYTMTFFAASEIFWINTVGLPFDSGTVIAGIALGAVFYFSLKYTRQKNFVGLNTAILFVLFVLVGFSSYVMLPIRAEAGTNINENDPRNARELLAYYNREQYPENPLFYGPQFTDIFVGLDEEKPYVDDKPKYEEDKESGKYIIVNQWKNAKQNTSDSQKAFLPRMWSSETSHIENYMNMTGPIDFYIHPEYSEYAELRELVREVKSGYAQGKIDNDGLTRFLKQYSEVLIIEKPTTAANFKFMFEYQFYYMYFRYFMWNFVGKQNDEQGKYTPLNGNWISGINFIDSIFLGSQDNLPDLVKNDPGRNTYFFLPLILGLIGVFYHFEKDKNSFWVLMVLFLFTGLALKVYLNERPFEPRERDYAVVGSFFAFTFWIGIGVYAIYDKLKKFVTPKILAPAVGLVCLLAVPGLMAQQNWDDHDRSGRYTATALAKNYLDSIDPNGIIFTIGDNDTFPLWYVQEIEGYRQDVRIINTSLFATDWYIDQMHYKAYESEGIKTQLEHKDYVYGTNDVIVYSRDERIPDSLVVDDFIKYVKSSHSSTRMNLPNDHYINTYPTKNLFLPVNKENVLKNGIVSEKDADKIVPYIPINVTANQITKNLLLMLDMVSTLDWERPVYFSGGSFTDSDYLWMMDYLELDGMVYKLVPIKTKTDGYDIGRIDVDNLYEKVMNWHWGNSGDPDIYYDPQTRRNSITYRSNIVRLAELLALEKDHKRAKDVLDLGMEKMPVKKFGFYTLVTPFVDLYYQIDEKDKAREVWEELAEIYDQKLEYYAGLTQKEQSNIIEEIVTSIERYRDLIDIAIVRDSEEWAMDKGRKFNQLILKFTNFAPTPHSLDADEVWGDSIDDEIPPEILEMLENMPDEMPEN